MFLKSKNSSNSSGKPERNKNQNCPISSRNIEYFKNILEYPGRSINSYHNEKLEKDIRKKLTSILTENKIISNTLENINNTYTNKENKTKTMVPIKEIENNINSNIPKKFLVTQFEKAVSTTVKIPKFSIGTLDAYYNNLHSQTLSTTENNTFKVEKVNERNLLNNTISSGFFIKGSSLNTLETSCSLIPKKLKFKKRIKIDKLEKKKVVSCKKLITDNEGVLSGCKSKKSKKVIIPRLMSFEKIKTELKKSNNTEIYKLPESLHNVRKKLNETIIKLAQRSREQNMNISNEQILRTLEKTKNSEYTKDLVEKIRVVNNYLSTIPQEKFKSEKGRHRKVFVLIDGSVVFRDENIYGQFVEIPTRRFLLFLESEKERLQKFWEFLFECQRIFRSIRPFKNIFLLNGISISDLTEIPDSDKAIYICIYNII